MKQERKPKRTIGAGEKELIFKTGWPGTPWGDDNMSKM